jgi:hypothetical protein
MRPATGKHDTSLALLSSTTARETSTPS